MANRILRGPYARSEETRAERALSATGAWVLAYVAAAACIAASMGAYLELARMVNLCGTGSSIRIVALFEIALLPLFFMAVKTRRTGVGLALGLTPMLALATNQVLLYSRLQLPEMEGQIVWIARDLAPYPIGVAFAALALYLGRLTAHTLIRHPSMEPTWGAKPVPAETAAR